MPTHPRPDLTDKLPDRETDFLQLEVETPKGVFVRTIRPAAFLPDEIDRGWAAETATRGAAAFWGLRDFVFRPTLQHRGAASRELGDTIVVVGPRAASVQVKSRHAPGRDERRERTWLDKKIAEGVRCGFHGFWPPDSTGFGHLIPQGFGPPVPRVLATLGRRSLAAA